MVWVMARSRYSRPDFEVVSAPRAAAEERANKAWPFVGAITSLALVAAAYYSIDAQFDVIRKTVSMSQTLDTPAGNSAAPKYR